MSRHRLQLGYRRLRTRQDVLVDHEDVGDVEDSRLEHLAVVTARMHRQYNDGVGRVDDIDFVLSGSDRSTVATSLPNASSAVTASRPIFATSVRSVPRNSERSLFPYPVRRFESNGRSGPK